jgi:hypothetical protein
MIQAKITPQITELQNTDSRLVIRDKALEREIKELNAMKSQGSQQNVDNRESLIAFVTANPDEDMPDTADIDARLKKAWLNRQAIHDARQSLKQKTEKAKFEAGTSILKSPEVQKPHGELMQRIAPPLAQIAKAWVELFGMSRELHDREIGFRHGICQCMPLDLFGPPNVYSPLASFLQAAVEAGFVKETSVPREYRAS